MYEWVPQSKKNHKFIKITLETKILLWHSYNPFSLLLSIPLLKLKWWELRVISHYWGLVVSGLKQVVSIVNGNTMPASTDFLKNSQHSYSLLTWHPYVFLKTPLLASEKFSKIQFLGWYYTGLQKPVDVFTLRNFTFTSIAWLLINITLIKRTEVLGSTTDMAILKE